MSPKNATNQRPTGSIDETFLNMSSLYHSAFSEPSATSRSKLPIGKAQAKFKLHLPSFLRRSPAHRFTLLHAATDDADAASNEAQGYERKTRHRHVHWADTPSPQYSSWTLITSLLLLFSITVNAFFFFEARIRHFTIVPHDAFQIKELGQNYTCYRTKETTFRREDKFDSLDPMYDHYWRDLLGKSNGYLYVNSSGVIREARFGMFHQLECLYQLRRTAQGTRDGKQKRKDFVFVGDADGEEELGWRHCFDYLRQTILCGADDTVEMSDGIEGGWGSFGYVGRRSCRNPGWLFDVTRCGRHGCGNEPLYTSSMK